MHGANLVPKPSKRVPTFITGFSQQNMDWFAEHGDGWMYYPRSPVHQAAAIGQWRELVEDYHPDVFKPFIQPMHLDLSEDPNERPTPIRLGYRTGRKALIELLDVYKSIGVNHLFLALFDGQRPADEVLDELEKKYYRISQPCKGVKRMKAIGLMQYGDKSVLQEIEMQTPLLGDNDVLIEVYAAGVNPVDWKIREGLLQDVISYDFPLVLGWDVAGVVAAIGKT